MLDIKTIIQAVKDETGIQPTLFTTSTINDLPAINYQIYRQGDTGTVESWRLQTRITAERLIEAMEIENSVADLLVSIGDEERFNTLSIQVNGGGTLLDEQTGLPQLITYYDITARS